MYGNLQALGAGAKVGGVLCFALPKKYCSLQHAVQFIGALLQSTPTALYTHGIAWVGQSLKFSPCQSTEREEVQYK